MVHFGEMSDQRVFETVIILSFLLINIVVLNILSVAPSKSSLLKRRDKLPSRLTQDY